MTAPDIRIVLLETTHAGNIGAAARAMKTMGLERLVLVRPRDFPDPEASARASGAQDLLERATVTDRLSEAIRDCRLVVGTTARERAVAWPTRTPREAAPELVALARSAPVAVLFGQERAGLTNEQVDRCQYLITIPANPAYSSLNLAAAVQLIAYELRLATGGTLPAQPAGAPPATAAELEGFYAHLKRVLRRTGFLDEHHPRLLRKLIRLYARARPTSEEVNILRGILTSVERPQGKT